jgi:hypothetical protein
MTETDSRYPDADRGFEIRVSPDERNVAIYDPGNAPWFIPIDRGRFVRTADLDKAGWKQYVPATDRDTILALVADWAHRSAEYGGLGPGDLVWALEQAGYTLPSPEEARAVVGEA